MTNEEKANNIVVDVGLSAIMNSVNGRKEQDTLELIKQSVLKMAEWKDEKFNEYLQEKMKKYENGGRLIILDIINELFEEEKK